MIDIVGYVSTASISAAAFCLLLAMLFVDWPRGWWARGIGTVLALAAIALPVFHVGTTLGRADPWPPEGAYLMQGWKVAEDSKRIYVMISSPRFDTPRQFELPFDLNLAIAIQNMRENALELEKGCLWVERNEDGTPKFTLRRLIMRKHQLDFDCERPPQF